MTSSAPWPPSGPEFHDELAETSTAELSDEEFRAVPALAARPPAGRFLQLDGRGLFVRSTAALPAQETDAWYVHGLAGSSTNWTQLAGALGATARGHLVDLPGHGRSDPPPRGRYSLIDYADLVAAAIHRTSPGPVHLVGNSLGGVVSTYLAARHPELIRTLTLISPAVPDLRMGSDRGADSRLALLMLPGATGVAHRRLGAIGPLQNARGMGRLCFGDPSLISDDDYIAAAQDLAWRAGLPWVHAGTTGSLRALMSSYLRPGPASFAGAARSITVPTLVVWGTRDRLVDARLAAPTVASFPAATLLMLAGVGHTAQMEDPSTTARAVLALWSRPGAPHPGITSAVATSTP